MSGKILVTYATRAGSTKGVAEAIGKTLSEDGTQVDVLPMTEVQDLQPYRAVVAGSAIRSHKWLPEAMKFMQTHQAELKQKPFAAFMVCMTLSMKNGKYLEDVKDWLNPVTDMVRPVSKGYFAGALDFSKLPISLRTLMLRVPVLFGVWSKGDHRDWDAIENWAKELSAKLR